MDPVRTVEEHTRFHCGTLVLEGVLAYPERGAPRAALLLLAPHPHMGGRMDNNVVAHIARRAAEDRCATLRFNYRGVGESSIELPAGVGLYDHWSAMEQEQRYEELLPDAVHAFEHLLEASADPARRVVLGYSLGAILAGMLASLVDATHLVGVSPPVAKVSLDAYRHLQIPKLFIGGDQDFAFDRERFDREFAQIPEPKRFVAMQDCDHFYRKHEERLYQAVAPFVTGVEAR
jgi:alpha/beta superfamily hydrolase